MLILRALLLCEAALALEATDSCAHDPVNTSENFTAATTRAEAGAPIDLDPRLPQQFTRSKSPIHTVD